MRINGSQKKRRRTVTILVSLSEEGLSLVVMLEEGVKGGVRGKLEGTSEGYFT